ncbi:MAG: 2-methylcitrate dehydratase [Rhodanobacteraceae bacterium]|jgi:2-methylcitrate dehydratase|nr:MAG: 2-methylcitrate dehydratase [Rhodanobacteraceae bacterium]
MSRHHSLSRPAERNAPGSSAALTEVQRLAAFIHAADFRDITTAAVEQLKIRILDTLGVAIAALDAPPLVAIRRLTESLGGNADATLIGGGRSAIDRAAFHNIALSRYLDFMDSYLAPGETCHPSDNIGAVLAAAESAGASGKDFLTAVAVAYQVQTRLSDVAPVRARGFDHTVQGAYAVAGAAAKALRLPPEQIANAIAISGTASNALRVTRTGDLSNWKGLAYPEVGKEGVFAALLARAGITGPAQVFEGNKGFKESIAGDFSIDWSREDLESVLRTVVKKHNAEVHSQSAIDAAITIGTQTGFRADAIRAVRVKTFQVAYDIIGGGEEGDKRRIRTKEEADHSLPYLVAVALLDGRVQPQQFAAERIARADVQGLLHRVTVTPQAAFTARFPAEMPTQVEVELYDGTQFCVSAASFQGFTLQPLDWTAACGKFRPLVAPFIDEGLAAKIIECVHHLDSREVRDLTALLAQVPATRTASGAPR